MKLVTNQIDCFGLGIAAEQWPGAKTNKEIYRLVWMRVFRHNSPVRRELERKIE